MAKWLIKLMLFIMSHLLNEINVKYDKATFSDKHALKNKENWLPVKLKGSSTKDIIVLKGKKQLIDSSGAEQTTVHTYIYYIQNFIIFSFMVANLSVTLFLSLFMSHSTNNK